MRRLVALLIALAAAAVVLPGRGRAADDGLRRESGYLTMEDGVRLRYTVVLPAAEGRYPVLFEYSGYDPGTNPDASHVARFVPKGYAYLGVNLRGTGCSEGTFDFFQPQEGRDGARVVEWASAQPWSTGKVGMIGKSYPGITQLFVAEQQPPHLAAIAPGHVFADAYRDVARPGGIENDGFATLWSFVARPSYEFQSSPGQVAAGDPGCARGSTAELTGLPTNPFVQLQQHRFDDALYAERSPITHLDRVRVPSLHTMAWQDEQLGSRQTDLLARLDDLGRTNWWATLTNGDHGMARTATELADLERFYDRFLKGVDNGWSRRPRVQVWWESGRDGGARAPGWTTALAHWSERRRAVAPWTVPVEPGTFTYAPVAGSQGVGNPRYGYPDLPDAYLWSQPPAPGTALATTTPPMTSDVTLLGSASLDLQLTSTAPDVDLEATITEVRPDGQEVFVQKGWLDVSQRALDPMRSTALRPYQTHRAEDARPLQPGTPVPARLEVFPFGHVFRAGSRLRVWIESPTALPELWAFQPSPYPAVTTILPGSRLVLPRVPGAGPAPVGLPACGTVIRQPCRPDPLAAR